MSSRKEVIFLTVEAGETGLSTRKLLLETAGFNVISAVSAEQALMFLDWFPIRALLFETDVHDIPLKDFVSWVRQHHPSVGVYVLSPQPWAPEELRGAVDGVVEKMADPRHMVEMFLQRYPGAASEAA